VAFLVGVLVLVLLLPRDVGAVFVLIVMVVEVAVEFLGLLEIIL
jgi:hypothetical protein